MPRKKAISVNMEHLKKTIEEMQPDRREIAEDLFKRLEFMKETLDGLQEQIKAGGPTSMFKQGSQEFERENPSLKAYNTTIQRYSLVGKQLIDLLPKAEEKAKADHLLEFIKGGPQ